MPAQPSSPLDPAARRKKIAALKAQADLEAEKMRQRIAQKQRERAIEREQEVGEAVGEASNRASEGGGRTHWATPTANVAAGFAHLPEATGKVTATGDNTSVLTPFDCFSY